jgi:hypothetical protein
MKHRLRTLLFISLLFTVVLISPTAAFAECGKERWAVKTGSDSDVDLVFTPSGRLRVRRTTVQNMIDFPYPFPNPRGIPRIWWDKRVPRYETTVWTLEVTLKEYTRENDEDYHLVLEDENGNTMVAEIADPPCVDANAPLIIKEKIKIARDDFDRKFNGRLRPTSRAKSPDVKIRIAGIGMFDREHGQLGRAPNGIELHPVLGIEFLDD